MKVRPYLNNTLNEATFRTFYYLKEELIAFCRENDLQTTGSKIELTERIACFLATGEKISSSTKNMSKTSVSTIDTQQIIEQNFVCSEIHRAFFQEHIGKGFKFNVAFQKWLKANAGKTYEDAIAAYYEILEEKKNKKSTIDKQFEYNTYIRDFFEDNKGKKLEDAIKCWKYKKSIQGHNKYESTDLNQI